MTIATVSAGLKLPASKVNELITAINAITNRQIYVASGSFTWPVGINAIRVTLCGGGGRSSASWLGGPGGSVQQPPGRGGDSPLCSRVIRGVDAGTSIPFTIGAPGVGSAAGGTTTFGAGAPYAFQSTGGAGGTNGTWGSNGAHTGDLQHGNELFIYGSISQIGWQGYGQAAKVDITRNINYSVAGGPGIIVIEY